jgi:hypothetical protein
VSADEIRSQLAWGGPGLGKEITQVAALAELRRYHQLYPDVPPEVAAMGLIRSADSWNEIRAVEAALAKTLRDLESSGSAS